MLVGKQLAEARPVAFWFRRMIAKLERAQETASRDEEVDRGTESRDPMAQAGAEEGATLAPGAGAPTGASTDIAAAVTSRFDSFVSLFDMGVSSSTIPDLPDAIWAEGFDFSSMFATEDGDLSWPHEAL